MPYYGYSAAGAASRTWGGSGRGASSSSSSGARPSDSECESETDGATSSGDSTPSQQLPYPGFADVALRYLTQDTRPRSWCLKLITNPWFERVSMLVILLNCVTLGMYQPCVDELCVGNRCKILQMFDDFIFAFFALEMSIKMVAMGIYGHETYLADSWNRLDFFIVLAGALEYCLNVENMNLSAIRTIRVLRPLRAINRIPSMRILVMLLLDTLPMLGNVLLLCFFVFFIFGIVGVQLWEGILRQRCELALPPNVPRPNISFYYEFSKEQDYICTTAEDSGMHGCGDFPPFRLGALVCNDSAAPFSLNAPTATSCVNWNQYYTNCTQRGSNPFQGTISFDNIGLAWVAIFLVISLEGWTDIMYYVQDAHSFWDWIYFVLLIVIGSFFMINLCLVVIATQFSETKKRELERMRAERARFTSTSTLASSTNNSEPATCYAELVKYAAHLWRRAKRRLIKKIRLYEYRRAARNNLAQPSRDTLQLCLQSQSQPARRHHPRCPRHAGKPPQSPRTQGVQTSEVCGGGIGGAGGVESVSDAEESPLTTHRPGLLRVPSPSSVSALCNADAESTSNLSLLSPPSLSRRRSSVMFSDVVMLHAPDPPLTIINAHAQHASTYVQHAPTHVQHVPAQAQSVTAHVQHGSNDAVRNVCSSEKMTQTDFEVPGVDVAGAQAAAGAVTPMSCQELLALSGALSAALPTGQAALDSFLDELTKGVGKRGTAAGSRAEQESRLIPPLEMEDYSCCADLQQCELGVLKEPEETSHSKTYRVIVGSFRLVDRIFSWMRKYVKKLVNHKYFQQGILLAILINTLSMGIEYHNQPEELTVIVEISNVVFSAIFAVEMMLKVVAEGPFGYIANGFNVFDGVIVVLSAFELAQSMSGGSGGSGLSVLRTFRLLRILKLVRFMPNLRRQLFVMLRTMDNVAVFFSLLVLFIFIFSILGMYLFGGKFCKYVEESGVERECTCPEIIAQHPRCECDRKHFNNILWATVTVFQILTQEDWNVVLFNGMEKTSHWAALYFVALMTFGNYVLFNLLVAILVEGFSSERNERREREQREQRELVKSKLSGEACEAFPDAYDSSRSASRSSDSFTQNEIKNSWRSADDVRKVKDSNGYRDRAQRQKLLKQQPRGPSHEGAPEHHKCNLQKECAMLRVSAAPATLPRPPPIITHTAATPQDSPNTTLEPGASFREFNYGYSLSNSSLLASIDSIDKTSCTSIPGLLKPPNSYSLTLRSAGVRGAPASDKARLPPAGTAASAPDCNKLAVSSEKLTVNANYTNTQYDKNIQLSKNTLQRDDLVHNNNLLSTSEKSSLLTDQDGHVDSKSSEGKYKFQRACSWKLSRPSLRRKNSGTKNRSGSDSDAIILNNGREQARCNGSGKLTQGIRRSDFLLQSTKIVNDTQGSNCSTGISPQNSFKGIPSQQCIKINCSVDGTTPEVNYNSWQTTDVAVSQPPGKVQLQKLSLTAEAFTGVKSTGAININNGLNDLNIPTSRQQGVPTKSSNITISSACGAPHVDTKVGVSASHALHSPHAPHALPSVKDIKEEISLSITSNASGNKVEKRSKLKNLFRFMEPTGCLKEREDFSLYVFTPQNRMRCSCTWLVSRPWFDNVVLLFIALNCITLAMERPNIPPYSKERTFLASANYVFTGVFAVEMFVKVVDSGMFYGADAYFNSGWNIMDGSLVIISIIDLLMSLISDSSPRIFGILRVFRLLRSLRPLRVINRAPGLKLVVQTLLSSLRPIGNIVLICCTFFIIFGILGVQLFKGAFFYCEGEHIKDVKNKTDCLAIEGNVWINRKYNFDDLGKALMSLFVLSSRDGWVNIMYTGLDAVGVDQQPVVNYSEWRLLYFIAFILLVGFFVLNMFVGVVVENFHRCREEQEKEERVRRAAKRQLQMEKKRRKMHEPPYYSKYGQTRLFVHNVVTSKYFDLAIAGVIGLNVVTMALEYYQMPPALEYTLKIFNYFFTAVFILEGIMKVVALGFKIYLKDKWNQLDVIIVILSIVGIVLEELQSNIIPINPTIMRVMRVLRIARVLKLLKMAKGIRALLDTVMQALPQVGNLGLLFFLLFFIFAALGVELFGRLECSDEIPCQGLGEHAHFANFGMAFLTLFRVATGDNWNGIMKDTLREECDSAVDCVRNCCVSTVIAPIFFVIFVLMAQFVLVNVVVAVLMKHLEESHKQMEDEMDMEVQLVRELEREQDDEEDKELCRALQQDAFFQLPRRSLTKVLSLPANFVYTPVPDCNSIQLYLTPTPGSPAAGTLPPAAAAVVGAYRRYAQRRQTLHSQHALLPHASVRSRTELKGRKRSASVTGSRRVSVDRFSLSSRGVLSRESSTESYQARKLRKRIDSIGSDAAADRSVASNAASEVLYEEDARLEEAEGPANAEMECDVVEQRNTNTIAHLASKLHTLASGPQTERAEGVPPESDTLLYNRRSKNCSAECGAEVKCLLETNETLDNRQIKINAPFLTVPKPTRSLHRVYGSSKHLFKQPAIDLDCTEEASLLLPAQSDEKSIDCSLPFLKLKIGASEYTPETVSRSGKCTGLNVNPNQNNGEFHTGVQTTNLRQCKTTSKLKDDQNTKTVPTSTITITESNPKYPEISEEEYIRNVIEERRKIDSTKPDYNSFNTNVGICDSTKVLIESRAQSMEDEGSSGIVSMQSQDRNNRHLSADRMSAANFSTSGESGDFLLGQRSSESYEETSDDQALTHTSASASTAAAVDAECASRTGESLPSGEAWPGGGGPARNS